MKTTHFFTAITIFIISFYNLNYAQGEAAIPSLYINPSPELTGLGWTGVSIPNNDPFGFYYNPANLGYFGSVNNLSAQLYSSPVDWGVWEGIKYNGYAINTGYNFKNELHGLNLSAGIGFIHSKFSFGPFSSASGFPSESYDTYDAFGLGVSIDYYVLFSVGMTFKNIQSKLSSISNREVNANAIDYGFLLTLPIMKLFNVKNIELSQQSHLIPLVNYTLGYSRSNIGDEVYYIDPAQSDPLLLTARLGHTITLGLDIQTDDINLNIINYDLILEADDILIDRKLVTNINATGDTITSSKTAYQGLLGDIDFGKHLIQLKGDEKVVVHKAHAISLAETVKILIGSFHGRGYMYKPETDGFVISSRGIFKMISYLSGNETLKFISDHFEIRYISSTLFEGIPIETDFSSVSISIMNMQFH